MKKSKRAKTSGKIIRLTWESLESHIIWTYKKDKGNGGRKFHRQCVKDYAKTIKLISKLY